MDGTEYIKLLVIGDVHICDHAPGKRSEGYKDHILAKLEECVSLAADKGATHVLFLGDIFHLKAANRVSHRLVQEMLVLMESFGLPVLILVGNHDITDGSLSTLSKQPLGTFEFLPNVTLLKEDPINLAPDVTVYPIAGTSGIGIDDFSILGHNKRDIMVVHQSIVPDISKENEMLHDILFDAKRVAENTNIDLVLYGHQHRCDGVYNVTRDNGTAALFSNLGSICRLTVTDDDVDKKPAVLFLEINTDEDRTVTNEVVYLTSVVPPQEAYELEDHLEAKEHSRDIEETIRKLKEAEMSSFSIEGVIGDVSSRQDIDKEVKQVALDLLEVVR